MASAFQLHHYADRWHDKVVLPEWVWLHYRSLVFGGGLLIVIAGFSIANLNGFPGRLNGDEGIYVSQAWAVENTGQLSHYEYWYDHPPLAWILLAGYAALTDGFDRVTSALIVGREMMAICTVVSSGLLYILCRRLEFSRIFAGITVGLFVLSPLSLQYHRMVFLDNVAMVFLLGSMVFAASPRRGLSAALGTGICFGCAMLCKETFAMMFPMVLWILLQHTEKTTRKWNLAVFGYLTFATGFLYILYALLKKELFAGPGHVSLQEALMWQLGGRAGSGAVWDTGSAAYNLVRNWLDVDPWLLTAGFLLLPAGFIIRQLRPIALGLSLLILVLFRGGYVPYPHLVGILPLAALLVGGTANQYWMLWRNRQGNRFWSGSTARLVSIACVSILVAAQLAAATPRWVTAARTAVTADHSGASDQMTDWIIKNIPKEAAIIVDDYHWPDLKLRGYDKQILYTKVDLDPAVQRQLLPDGYESVDYVALGPLDDKTMHELPTVATAIHNSHVIAEFGNGEFTVRQVDKS